MTIPPQFQIKTDPIADQKAIVSESQARFTMLTPRLIRMEYSPSGSFQNWPSQVFWHRRQSVPEFQVRRSDGLLEILTDSLHLRYTTGAIFSESSLSIEIISTGVYWRYGDLDNDNLGGTARTLDQTAGPIQLEPGLLSRRGWTVIDDSRSLVFNPQGWLELRQAPAGDLDLYFFGYGRDYRSALGDYFRVTGSVPLVPRWALGNWWSRYWPYSQDELLRLMNDFQRYQIPLGVCIIDMDWHITQTGNASSGWTGYTWNRDLFPDPPGLLSALKELGLKKALNLHPADGIWPHEKGYTQMAQAQAIDPATRQPVPFDLEDPGFVKAYFEILHHPQESDGVDFWWMDWQQGNPARLAGLNLLWWINHIHFYDSARNPDKRPFLFSRWGGLGNHRYPVGFSGDTEVTWEALAFQPYFTATAANVGFGWWSHDIGGHMNGIEEAELYTRWVQLGVFSPILRLHSTQNPFHERRPWGYDAETLRITRDALQLRHALIPYLYSMAWREHEDGISPIRPMYHLHPEQPQAYACPNQYYFGSELIAAPFTQQVDPDTRLSRQVVWLPPGDWYEFGGNRHLAGGWHAVYGGMDEVPVFARAGAIVLMSSRSGWEGITNPEVLEVHIYPGAHNCFELYEDDGESQAYLHGHYALTSFELEWHATQLSFHIRPVEGQSGLIPALREYKLVFHALQPASQITASINSKGINLQMDYDLDAYTLTVVGVRMRPQDECTIHLQSGGSLVRQETWSRASAFKLVKAFRMETDAKRALHAALPGMIAQPIGLTAYQTALTPSQRRALLETLSGSGIDLNVNTGEPLVVLWNNNTDPQARFSLSVDRQRSHPPQNRFQYESGVLPVYKAIGINEAWGVQPALLRVQYGDLLTTTLNYQPNSDSLPAKLISF